MSQVFIPTPAHTITIQNGGSGYGAGSNVTFGGAGTAGWSYTEKQHEWLLEYKIDPISMGEMCEKYPSLSKSWSQFKMMYNLCKSEESND